MMRRGTKPLALLAAACLALTACGASTSGSGSSGSAPENYPSESLDWTVAFGPGGGNDIMSRTIADILEKKELYPADIAVTNREGGSGAKGWGYLFGKSGKPYNISTTSGSFITTPLQADTGWKPDDFTPVGLFAVDDLLFLTSGKGDIKTWKQWVKYAKANEPVAIGGIGTVNVDFIVHSLLAEKAGYEIDYVSFNEEGQLKTSLLSGAVDAIVSNPGEVLGQVKAGDMIPLLFTGDEPLKPLPDVPTAPSLGFDNLVSMPRGLILPPDVSDEVQQWWIDTMKKVVETKEWKQYLEKNHLSEKVVWGDDFGTYLKDTQDKFRTILEEQGALEG